jgi:Uma2 family endonuclease
VVSLTRNDYEPDICFWSKAQSQHFKPEQMQFPPPDFIVEVLSKSTEKRDRGIKFEDYAAHGTQEYWLVNPERQSVEQYFLENGECEIAQKAKLDELIKSKVIPDFEIPVNAIFDKKVNSETLLNLLSTK